MFGKLNAFIQYLLPKQLLTIIFGWIAERKWGFLTTWTIKLFVKLYKVDLNEAQDNKAEDYKTFNAFFARPLKEGMRPFEENAAQLIFPVDGKISEFGQVQNGALLQAKDHLYSLDALLACQPELCAKFKNGLYVTTYLAPSDYHRVHMPCDGKLREMIYVPGSLFSVSPSIVANIDGLFARNERVICVFETPFGLMTQILVGATIVGSIETVWGEQITPPRDGLIKRWTYEDQPIELKKGDEMGLFKLGSTVINLFEADKIALQESLKLNEKVKLGMPLATQL